MIEKVEVVVQSRTEVGKNACRRLRAEGRIPAVVYGMDKPSLAVTVNRRIVENVLKLESGRNSIFTLKLGEDAQEKRAVMIREIQRDPVSGVMSHLDFVRVDLEKKLTVSVPVQLVGVAHGVKNEGGVLEFMHRSVQAECLPTDIPGHFEIDVSELHVNQQVSAADIVPGENVRILDDASTIIALVSPPKAEEEPEEEAAAAAEGEEAAAEGEEKKEADGGEAESKGE